MSLNRCLVLSFALGLMNSMPLIAEEPPPQEVMPEVKVALTFDDGPVGVKPGDPLDITGDIRKIVEKHGAHATFFVEHSRIGGKLKDIGAAQLKEMDKGGHEVAIHGAHPVTHHLSYALTDDLADKFNKMKDLVKAAIGKVPVLVRPPGGEKTLEDNFKAGKVTSPLVGGPKDIDKKWTLDDVKKAESAAGLKSYLDDGTNGKESWLTQVESFDETKNPKPFAAAEAAVSKRMDEAKAAKKVTRVIILMHDVGGSAKTVKAGLDDFLTSLEKLAADKKVLLHFYTMSQVIK